MRFEFDANQEFLENEQQQKRQQQQQKQQYRNNGASLLLQARAKKIPWDLVPD